MPINGNLRTMPLPDLLQWISMSQKTGTLLVKDRQFTKRVFFQDGSVSAVASENPRERLGHYLVGWGMLSATQLQALLDQQAAKDKALGELVVENGLLSREQMTSLARFTAEEIVFSLMRLEEGDFRFVEDNLPGRTYRELMLGVDHFLFEGARRIDDMRRHAEVIPDNRHVPHVVAQAPDQGDAHLARVLGAVDGERSIEEIAMVCRVSEFHIASVVYHGVKSGYLALTPPQSQSGDTPASLSWHDFVREAETSLSLGDYLEAYQHVTTLRRSFPSSLEASERGNAILARIEAALAKTAVAREVVLELGVDFKHLTTLQCTPEEAFVLSRVNGRYTVPQILALFPGDKLHGRVLIHSLLQQAILKYRESQAVEKFRDRRR